MKIEVGLVKYAYKGRLLCNQDGSLEWLLLMSFLSSSLYPLHPLLSISSLSFPQIFSVSYHCTFFSTFVVTFEVFKSKSLWEWHIHTQKRTQYHDLTLQVTLVLQRQECCPRPLHQLIDWKIVHVHLNKFKSFNFVPRSSITSSITQGHFYLRTVIGYDAKT